MAGSNNLNFYSDSMSLLAFCILLVGAAQRAHGADCAGTWVWVQPDGVDSQVLSDGAPVTFQASVADGTLEDGNMILWKIGDVTLITDTYDTDAFTSVAEVAGVTTSFDTPSAGSNRYTVTIPRDILTVEAHNGQSVTVRSGACDDAEDANKVSTGVSLTVKYCDNPITDGTLTGPANCGYECTGNFDCSAVAGLTFQATCQAEATWSTTTTPTDGTRCRSCNLNQFSAPAPNPGTAQNSDICGAGCTKTFVCDNYASVTFEATCQDSIEWSATTPAEAERCSLTCASTWVWIQPSGVSTQTLSVGAPVTFQASVDDDLVADDVVQWKIGTVILITDTYNAVTNAFTSVVGETGVTSNFADQSDGFGHTYTVTIPENTLTTAYHDQLLTVRSETCDDDAGKESPPITLTVQYCDLTYFTGATNPGTNSGTDDCGYNCVRVFACSASDATGLTFEATCQAEAAWSATTPAVDNRCRSCDLTHFSGSTVTNPGTAQNDDPCGINCEKTFTCTSGTSVTFRATCQSDLTWSETTPVEAERCTRCDLTSFSGSSVTNPGTAENDDACVVDCVKTFKCTSDESLTFQATCQQDLTWSETTPAEAQRCTSSSRSSSREAALTLVILASIVSITF